MLTLSPERSLNMFTFIKQIISAYQSKKNLTRFFGELSKGPEKMSRIPFSLGR